MLNFPIVKKSGARFEVCVCVCVERGGGTTPLFGLYSSGLCRWIQGVEN